MRFHESVQFKLTPVGKIQRTKKIRKKLFYSVISNDIKSIAESISVQLNCRFFFFFFFFFVVVVVVLIVSAALI